ncbi:MAG: FlgB family protein [Pseudomonadota bacterium]
MFETLEIFDLATARARHAALRQNVVARNIANADTPGFRAQTTADFQDVFRRLGDGERMAMADFGRPFDAHRPISPNGNSVSLELEMVASIDAQRAHNRALNVYRSAMNVMRTSIGR